MPVEAGSVGDPGGRVASAGARLSGMVMPLRGALDHETDGRAPLLACPAVHCLFRGNDGIFSFLPLLSSFSQPLRLFCRAIASHKMIRDNTEAFYSGRIGMRPVALIWVFF